MHFQPLCCSFKVELSEILQPLIHGVMLPFAGGHYRSASLPGVFVHFTDAADDGR
jgi:hypothetical protein